MALMDLYCTKCSLQFDKKIIFNMHLNIVHKEKIEIKEEQTDSNLKEETETRKKAAAPCEICGKTFFDMSTMKKHIASVHEKKKPFKCEICDYSFSEKGSMKKHVASVHAGKKPFKCDICDYNCSEKGNMKRHV